jgi:hypothetical protein
MDRTLTIQTSHLTSVFDIAGALIEAGGSDSITPPSHILTWADAKKVGTVAAKENWVLMKTRQGMTLYHFHTPVKLA